MIKKLELGLLADEINNIIDDRIRKSPKKEESSKEPTGKASSQNVSDQNKLEKPKKRTKPLRRASMASPPRSVLGKNKWLNKQSKQLNL